MCLLNPVPTPLTEGIFYKVVAENKKGEWISPLLPLDRTPQSISTVNDNGVQLLPLGNGKIFRYAIGKKKHNVYAFQESLRAYLYGVNLCGFLDSRHNYENKSQVEKRKLKCLLVLSGRGIPVFTDLTTDRWLLKTFTPEAVHTRIDFHIRG